MGTKLENATKQEIVEVLKKACILADIDAPTDINMLVEYMHDKFRATLDEVSKGIDLWITIESRIVKPRRLNIKFLGEVINLYRTQNRLTTKEKHNDYKRYEIKRSAKEQEAMWRKSYNYAWQDFYTSISENNTKFMLKQLEVLHDWLAEKVSLRYTDDQVQDEVEWLKGYHKRYFENLHKDETNPFKKIAQKYNEPKDLQKAARVSIHFRLRMGKGERPNN